jgi:hypothetical protein
MRTDTAARPVQALARRTALRPRRRPVQLIATLFIAALPLVASESPAAASDVDQLVADCLRTATRTADAAEAWIDHCREHTLIELRFRGCMANVPRSADAAERWASWCRDADVA